MPAPVAHETQIDGDDPLVLHAQLGRLGQQVDLVQDDDLRQLVEARAVGGQLAVDRGPALGRLAVGGVDHVHEHPRALQVREELVAEPDALARALDQPRTSATVSCRPSGASTVPSIGASVVNGYSATFGRAFEIRVRERRLARVREPDERRVRDQLQPQLELGLLARQADLGEARRLPRRGREAPVASPPRPRRERGPRARPGSRGRPTSLSSSKICVPAGTRSSTLSPEAPCFPEPPPDWPRFASIHLRR